MSTLLNKSYLVKVSTKGGGGVKNAPNSVYVVCTQPLKVIKNQKCPLINAIDHQAFPRCLLDSMTGSFFFFGSCKRRG